MWNKDGGGKEENMSEGLLKIFIKDYKNVKDIKVRENYGIFAGIVGIICNLILFACKFLQVSLPVPYPFRQMPSITYPMPVHPL